jgi:membrane protease YdiL (CAAX protease family)
MNRHLAVAVSALIFGFAHWEGPDVLLPVIGLTLLAVPLAYAALRNGDLSLPIVMHAGINLLAFLVLVFEDDLNELIEQTESGITLLFHWFM